MLCCKGYRCKNESSVLASLPSPCPLPALRWGGELETWRQAGEPAVPPPVSKPLVPPSLPCPAHGQRRPDPSEKAVHPAITARPQEGEPLQAGQDGQPVRGRFFHPRVAFTVSFGSGARERQKLLWGKDPAVEPGGRFWPSVPIPRPPAPFRCAARCKGRSVTGSYPAGVRRGSRLEGVIGGLGTSGGTDGAPACPQYPSLLPFPGRNAAGETRPIGEGAGGWGDSAQGETGATDHFSLPARTRCFLTSKWLQYNWLSLFRRLARKISSKGKSVCQPLRHPYSKPRWMLRLKPRR